MTVVEFFGCTFLAFGPPFAMFVFTIAHDPVRIIILIAAAFFWLLSLLLSSLWWYIVIPLREDLVFGVIFSVFFQEGFRYIIYKILRKAESGLKKITDDSTQLIENKHILAYVSGLGFGIISGAFSLVNVLADAVGPGTMGLKSGSEMFFLTSSATGLCFILLHTFWGVIFFNALDNRNKLQVTLVVVSHLLASSITLFNHFQVASATLIVLYFIVLVTGSGNVNICEVTDEVKRALKDFRFRKAQDTAALILKVDREKQQIVIDEKLENITIEELQESLQSHQPRYIILSYRQKHSDGRISYPLCFIYFTPRDSHAELQMMYAGSKISLQREADLIRGYEIRELEDFTEEWLLEKLGN
ncbi:gamma-secretase subunit Aph-1 [Asbolus verrucosus]|uniref:Gamma-secretase subunit Aph-1 n=1 Tax=Asbolus verrucosus TaxID=1661398 RepID=A0A482VJ65_ASBVE|nr:gamma-secretase subunit Aph-1 [Asbolus verrucosus]